MFEVVDFNGDGLLDVYVVDDGADKLLMATSHQADVSLGFTTTDLGFVQWFMARMPQTWTSTETVYGGARRRCGHPTLQQQPTDGHV